MEYQRLTYYDIYGFVLAVDSGMKKAFDLEYWRFKTKPRKANLYVLRTDKKDLPIKLRMAKKGISIPFGKKENTVFYENGVFGQCIRFLLPSFTALRTFPLQGCN